MKLDIALHLMAVIIVCLFVAGFFLGNMTLMMIGFVVAIATIIAGLFRLAMGGGRWR